MAAKEHEGEPSGKASTDWQRLAFRTTNVGLEATVFYLFLAVWAQPRDGPGALLPLLACAALLLGLSLRQVLDSATAPELVRQLAVIVTALAWALLVARVCAPLGYWHAEAPRVLLLLGVVFGGREGSALQPLAFWASVLLWWRGHALAVWDGSFEEALSRFRLGCLVVGVALTLSPSADSPDVGSGAWLEQVLGVGAFFVTALLTTGISRRQEMAGTAAAIPTIDGPAGSQAAGSRPTFSALFVGLAACAALGVAALGAGALSPEALAPAIALGGLALETIAGGVSSLLQLLGSLWPPYTPQVSVEQPGRASSATPTPPVLPEAMFAWLGPLLSVVILAGVLVGAALVFAAMRRVFERRSAEIHSVDGQDDEGPKAVAPRGPATILALLGRLLQTLISRPRDRARVATRRLAVAARHRPGVESVRAVYRAYLAWAATQGYARKDAETPDEFRRRVVGLRPEAAPEAILLTTLYVAARYGGQPASASDLRRAQQALERLESRAPPSDPRLVDVLRTG